MHPIVKQSNIFFGFGWFFFLLMYYCSHHHHFSVSGLLIVSNLDVNSECRPFNSLHKCRIRWEIRDQALPRMSLHSLWDCRVQSSQQLLLSSAHRYIAPLKLISTESFLSHKRFVRCFFCQSHEAKQGYVISTGVYMDIAAERLAARGAALQQMQTQARAEQEREPGGENDQVRRAQGNAIDIDVPTVLESEV